MQQLDPAKTALVLIDLQQGILPVAAAPYTGDEVVARAAALAAAFRVRAMPVVLVRVGWCASGADALRQPVDAPAPGGALADNWWDYPAALTPTAQDIQIVKHQWGRFTAPSWICSCAVAASIRWCWGGSRPISGSNRRRAAPGSMAMGSGLRRISARRRMRFSTATASAIFFRALLGCRTARRYWPRCATRHKPRRLRAAPGACAARSDVY